LESSAREPGARNLPHRRDGSLTQQAEDLYERPGQTREVRYTLLRKNQFMSMLPDTRAKNTTITEGKSDRYYYSI